MLGTETSLKSLTSATRPGPAAYATKSKAGKNTAPRTVSGAIAEYKRQHCASMGIGIGPRLHSECPFGVIFDQYQPDNSEALERVIKAAYRQVLGNLPPTDNQREISLKHDFEWRNHRSRFRERLSQVRFLQVKLLPLCRRPTWH